MFMIADFRDLKKKKKNLYVTDRPSLDWVPGPSWESERSRHDIGYTKHGVPIGQK